MALQFFRRRQKLVIGIMVVLMLTFLVGGYGANYLTARPNKEQKLGWISTGEITRNDIKRADAELYILNAINSRVFDQDYAVLLGNGGNAALAYVMLSAEAKASSVALTKQELESLLMQRGLDEVNIEALSSALRPRLPAVTVAKIRDTAAAWLRIKKMFIHSLLHVASGGGMPPGTATSERQLRRLYRDLSETIELRIAALPAEEFLDRTAEPTTEQIDKQFADYRANPPGMASEENPFGFGYIQAHRARLLYLLVRQDVVERVVRPGDKAVRDYYRLHKAELVKQAPVADSQPATDGNGGESSASRPAAHRSEPMTFSEAKEQIVELLTAPAVKTAMNNAVGHIRATMDAHDETAPGAVDAYHWALSKMTGPADSVLRREIVGLDIQAQPLDAAVAYLAEQAQLEAIAFPWGRGKAVELAPDVRVTIQADRITLASALDEICRQLELPKLHWATSPAFKGVLFSVKVGDEGIDFFPIQVEQTPLMDPFEMSNDEIVGNCATSAGRSMTDIVFAARPFGQANTSGMVEGDDGPRMVVTGPRAGRLLWRLAEAKPAHSPATIEEVPGLADKVKRDIRLREAFALAAAQAAKLSERAASVGLAAAARELDVATFETGPFTRKVMSSPQQQYQMLAQLSGKEPSQIQLAMLPPFSYPLSNVSGVKLTSPELMKSFMDAAFALAPDIIEPPYPDSPRATGVLRLPSMGRVLVMERTDFKPAVIGEYAKARATLAAQAELNRIWQYRILWFGVNGIAQRLGWRPVAAQ